MNEKALTLRQELPRLIQAARSLGASMLVMLLVNVDKELRKHELEHLDRSERDLDDRS